MRSEVAAAIRTDTGHSGPARRPALKAVEPEEARGRFAVVIVNWKGWQDVVECLESLFRSDPLPERVVVCDNGSDDGSLERIRDWAEGRLAPILPPDHPLRRLVNPSASGRIPCVEYDRRTAEAGGAREGEEPPLVLIQTGGNLGYAAGTNVGLRYLLALGGESAVWLLNPDTVVEPGAGRALLEGLESDPMVGICGSTVRYHQHPHLNQALGGAKHNWWIALPRHIGAGTPASAADEGAVASGMTYVYGASMMVSRAFLHDVGLLDEGYFLYFEELDMAMRGRQRGFSLSYAPGSVVYHRGGGGPDGNAGRSAEADYYFLRNRIRVTRRFRPLALPGAYLAVLAAVARRAARGEWGRVRAAARILVEGWGW